MTYYIINIIPLQDGFVLIITEEDQDNLFQEQVKNELNHHNFFTILPPELKAKRSIIAFNVNTHIYNNPAEDMLDELHAHNDWMNNSIESVFKFPNSKIMKITFNQAAYALKAQEQGLKLYSMKIPKHQIQHEKFYSVQTCFRCYKIDHLTKNCPQNSDYNICSECSERGHNWRQCTKEKKCINCQENHRTLYMRCKMRKDAIKKKRNEEKVTYSETLKTNITPNVQPLGLMPTHDNVYIIIYSCMIHTHLMNVIEPGCYEEELKATLKENNLPSIKIPRVPDSSKLLSTLANLETRTNVMETEGATAPTMDVDEHQQEEDTQIQEGSLTKTGQEETVIHQGNIRTKMDCKDIQLEFFTKTSNGWPDNLTISKLTTGINKGIYKIIYL